jgi:ring-1,2-phenylacetyl-CoA epoxidase subunit PaaD
MPTIEDSDVWQVLEDVKDPEIPVISVVELGVIRAVSVEGGRVTVDMTPTFSGCPALDVMRHEIEQAVLRLGADSVEVKVRLAPPWSTDMISDEARAKLEAFGLAPPPRHGGQIELIFFEEAVCPHCRSTNTSLKNSFGPTLCRMIFYCNDCRQPFEQFKAL